MPELTPNYSLHVPTELDDMGDVDQWLTTNFETLEPRANPTVIAAGGALPQVGSYNLGDRVFRADPVASNTYPSSYILVCKDSIWGWHWRPVQQIMSPWINLPSGIINDSNFEIHPTFPVAISYDSRGFVHWRGAFRKTTANIAEGTSFTVLKNMPEGLKPNLFINRTVPVSPVVSGTTEEGFVGGRFACTDSGVSSFRFSNTNNATSQVFWMTGLCYQPAREYFTSA